MQYLTTSLKTFPPLDSQTNKQKFQHSTQQQFHGNNNSSVVLRDLFPYFGILVTNLYQSWIIRKDWKFHSHSHIKHKWIKRYFWIRAITVSNTSVAQFKTTLTHNTHTPSSNSRIIRGAIVFRSHVEIVGIKEARPRRDKCIAQNVFTHDSLTGSP